MKKVADVLLLVGFILGIIGTIFGLVSVITLFSLSGNRDAIIQALKDGTIHTSFVGDVEQQADAICRLFRGLATGGLVGAIVSVILLVILMITRKKGTTGWYIITLVLSVLTLSVFPLIGSILGLIANGNPEDGGEEQALEE